MENTNTYLKEKVIEHLNVLKGFETKLRADSEEIQIVQEKIANFKATNPEGSYTDVRQELVDVISLHYGLHLVNQSYQMRAVALYELGIFAKMCKIELGLPEEDQQAVDNVTANMPYVHTLDKGKIAFVGGEITDSIQEGLKNKVNNEQDLKETYEGFLVKTM